MYAQVEKTKKGKSKAVANSVAQKKSGVQGFGFVDNRSGAVVQRKILKIMNESTQVHQMRVMQLLTDEERKHAIEYFERKLPGEGAKTSGGTSDIWRKINTEVPYHYDLEAAKLDIDSIASLVEGPGKVVELGAGEGRFSSAFRRKFAPDNQYIASDVAVSEGTTGFLRQAHEDDVSTQYGLDANKVHQSLPPQSVSRFVAANPYGGGRDNPDASFGLMKYNPDKRMEPDPRFLRSASKVLKPGGEVDFYGRTNTLRKKKQSEIPTALIKGEEPDKEKRKTRAKLREMKKKKLDKDFPETNENPYLNINPDQLSRLAKETGYRVRVKRAKQPSGTVQGGDPDTVALPGNTRNEGLQPFTTRMTFTHDPGYESEAEHPRVDYDTDIMSDWEGDEDQ